MEGMVDNAKAYLESDEGQQFERGLQREFLGNKQNAGPAGASAARDSSDPSQASSSGGDDDLAVGPGSAGQGEDSTSGMNSMPQSRLNESDEPRDETADYNAAGREQQRNDGPYTASDTATSGGYGTNETGDSFSSENQSGVGDSYPRGSFADNSN